MNEELTIKIDIGTDSFFSDLLDCEVEYRIAVFVKEYKKMLIEKIEAYLRDKNISHEAISLSATINARWRFDAFITFKTDADKAEFLICYNTGDIL
jgi:NOL1/NOP2/fmu family ribosome biogenesis protein